MAKDFKAQSAAHRTGSPRLAIPQIDPGESPAPRQRDVAAPTGQSPPATVAIPTEAAQPTTPGPRPPERTAPPLGNQLPMPPSRQAEMRVQFNTKLPPELVERVKRFSETYRSELQDISELALEEFLNQRGF